MDSVVRRGVAGDVVGSETCLVGERQLETRTIKPTKVTTFSKRVIPHIDQNL